MSEIFQLPNDSKEHKPGKAITFPTDSKSELEFVVNDVNVKQDLPATLLCRDASESERFSIRLSFQSLSDIEDKYTHQELGEDYCSPYLHDKEVISSSVNKGAQDQIDQLTGIFRNCGGKNIYRETEVLHDGTPRLAKGLKLKTSTTSVVQQYSSISSNSSRHRPSFEEITMAVVQRSSISSNGSSHRLSFEGRESFSLEVTNSPFESEKADSPKEIETLQNDSVGQSKLPLPPRLMEASNRNPLVLSPKRSPIRMNSTELPPPSCLVQLFSPRGSPRRNSEQPPGSPLSKMVKKQKGIWVKLWRSSLDLIREYIGKLEYFLQFPMHPHRRQAAHGNPDCSGMGKISKT